MNLLQDEVEMYQPIKYATVAGNDPVYVFSIQRRLIDYRDIHKEVGSVLISVDERVLQDAMKAVSYTHLSHGSSSSAIYFVVSPGRIRNASPFFKAYSELPRIYLPFPLLIKWIR